MKPEHFIIHCLRCGKEGAEITIEDGCYVVVTCLQCDKYEKEEVDINDEEHTEEMDKIDMRIEAYNRYVNSRSYN